VILAAPPPPIAGPRPAARADRRSPVPQRILMTADTVGGVWTYALELARTLVHRGIHIHLATMGGMPSREQAREAEAIPRLTLHPSAWRLEWMDDPWDDVARSCEWLLELERRLRPDVVHLNTYVHGVLPWRAPALVVGHSCVCSWWKAVRGTDAPASWDRYRESVAAGLRAVRLVIAPTASMLRRLKEHYGPLPDARVVANGRDPALFRPREAEDKEPLILCAARLWDEAKNLAALDRIAPALPWATAAAGDCAHPDGGERRPRSLSSLGFLDRAALAQAYGRAAIYCLPARYEPFGLSVLEAALSGCALVLGDIDSLRESWDGCALFVDPGDDRALAAALTSLADDADLRRQAATRARRRADAFRPERMRDGYLRAYAHLLAATPDPPRSRSHRCAS
jgi:glycogen synthase